MKYDFSQWARYPEPANLREWMFQELEFIRSICYQPYGGLPPEKIAPTYFQPQSFRMLWELFCLGGVKLTCVDDDLIMIDPGPNINELWKELNPHKQDPTKKEKDSLEISDHAEYDETDYALLQECSTREPVTARVLEGLLLSNHQIQISRKVIPKRMQSLETDRLVEKLGARKGWKLTQYGLTYRKELSNFSG